ncbi:MAG: hypothetical protein QME94_15695, partial [Anaerolineae bacterium]|nr:hypothetical protein [Anaerolineae bacterium]
ENGVVTPFLLVGLELVTQSRRSLRELARQPARWFFVAPALFVVLWVSVPKLKEAGLATPAYLLANSLPFLQAYVYPLLPLPPLRSASGLRLAALAAAALILMCAVAALTRRRRLYLFALLWLAVAALPSMLMLEPAYLYGSPRLYYLVSVGAALFWGLPVLALDQLCSGPAIRRYALRGLQLLIALGVVLPPLAYIRCELYFFEVASQLVRQMASLAGAAPPQREVVFVNVPFYFSSCQAYPSGCEKLYPIAPIGAVVIPPYADARDFVRVNGGPDRPARGVAYAGYNPGWATYGAAIEGAALRELAREAEVHVFDLVGTSWFDLTAAWQTGVPRAMPGLASYGQVLALEEVSHEAAPAGLEVVLRWRVLERPEQPLKVFVHLYDQTGALATQHDGPPAQGYVPPSLWEPGDLIIDRHTVPAPATPPAGPLRLAIGLYDPNTGARLTARSPDGATLADNACVAGEVDWP